MKEILEAPELNNVKVSAIVETGSGKYAGFVLSLWKKSGTVKSVVVPEDDALAAILGIKDISTVVAGTAKGAGYNKHAFSIADYLRRNSTVPPEEIKEIETGRIENYFRSIGYTTNQII